MFGSFDDNGEGLDKKFCLHFYSRFKFVTELAPLLQAAKDAGEEARVVTVMGAGRGSRADLKFVFVLTSVARTLTRMDLAT